MSKALYRKWRPMTFSDVVGQPQVTETLKKQLASGRLSHAYLFTGTRGTGKTTCAKLLAKAANCLDPQNGEPCNKCAACLAINEGSAVDISEIDAASNSGVDNIRAIRDQAAYTPVELTRRVYIIDECHMLSSGAWNALLKTLEEPPAHVLFILATTELHKIPPTILSRCQRFSFRRGTARDLANRVSEIAAAEGIALTEDGAAALARLADGGFRDAISMLDQCASAREGATLDEAAILDELGLAGSSDTLETLEAIARGDVAGALGILDKLYSAGKDMSAYLSELAAAVRDALVLAATRAPALLGGRYSAKALTTLGLQAPVLSAMLGEIGDAQARLARSASARLEAELCIVRLATLAGSQLFDAPAYAAPATAGPSHAAPPATSAPERSAAEQPIKVQKTVVSEEKPPISVQKVVEQPTLAAEDSPPWETAPAAVAGEGDGAAAAARAESDDLLPWSEPPSSTSYTRPSEPPAHAATSAPGDDDIPPPYDEAPPPDEPPFYDEPARTFERPKAAPQPSPAQSAAGWWQDTLLEVRPMIPISHYMQLSAQPQAELSGDVLTVRATSDFSRRIISDAKVLTALGRAASKILGKTVSARCVGQTEQEKRDAMDELLAMQTKFDNFTVE